METIKPRARASRVYIAGPYTKGDTAQNVRNAIQAADTIRDLGFAPYVPHLTHFWNMVCPRNYDDWMDLDAEFLVCCDALVRLPGESPGANEEEKLAYIVGIPVYRGLQRFRTAVVAGSLPVCVQSSED